MCTGCSLVQLADVIDPTVLFGALPLRHRHLRDDGRAQPRLRAPRSASCCGSAPSDLVVEVASNDGSLLRLLPGARRARAGGRARGQHRRASRGTGGIPTEVVFFGARGGARLRERHGPARAVIGNNVLAHVDDPVGFPGAAPGALLAEDGLAIIEVPWLGEMVDRLEYDTVYHEHLCYFSVTALLRIAEAAGLRIVRVDRVPVHGGSIRVYAAPSAPGGGHAPGGAGDGGRTESSAGLTDLRLAAALRRPTRRPSPGPARPAASAPRRGARASPAYGAPAKGNTLLNYCGIGTDLVAFTVDRSPLKEGLLHARACTSPCRPVEALLAEQPDYALLLAWNFADEIVAPAGRVPPPRAAASSCRFRNQGSC